MEGESLQSESESPQISNCDRGRSHECDQEDTGSLINPPSKSSETTLGESDASTRSDKEICDLLSDSIEPYMREQRMSTGNGQGVNDHSDCTSTLQDHSVFGNEMSPNRDQEGNNCSAHPSSMSSELHVDKNGISSEKPQDINHLSVYSSPKSSICETVEASQIEVDNDFSSISFKKPEDFRYVEESSISDEHINNPSVSSSVSERDFQSYQKVNHFSICASNSTAEHLRRKGSFLRTDQSVIDNPLSAFQESSSDVCVRGRPPPSGQQIGSCPVCPSSESLHLEEERLPQINPDANDPPTSSSFSTFQPTLRKKGRPTKCDKNSQNAPDSSLYSSDRPVRKRGRPPKSSHKFNISSAYHPKLSEKLARKRRSLLKCDENTKNAPDASLNSSDRPNRKRGRPPKREKVTNNGTSSSSKCSDESVNKGTRLSENNNRRYQCTYCESVFSNGSNLIKHVRLHTGEKPYKCEFCSNAYSDISNFKFHMSNHTGDKPHKCTGCDRTFFRKSDLDNHMRTHTGERPYSCPQCNKAFSCSSSLRLHIVCHSDEKKFKCLVCGVSFRREADLEKHTRRHTGERPYKCGLCNDTFTSREALKHHMMLHTGERPHKCGYCSAAFVQKSNLNIHLLTHDADVMFTCGFCGVCYRTKRHLTRHKNIHHAESLEVC